MIEEDQNVEHDIDRKNTLNHLRTKYIFLVYDKNDIL